MHLSAYDKVQALINGYLGDLKNQPLNFVEIGSMVAEATQFDIKPLLSGTNWSYIGVDIAAGNNVDVVLKDPYAWAEIADASVDIILANQVFEHVEFPWITMKEIERVLKPQGVALIVSPAGGIEHRFPYDCYRIYPDGWRALCKHAGLNAIETAAQWKPLYYTDGSDKWQDSSLVAQKSTGANTSAIPPLTNREVLRHYAKQRADTHGGYCFKYKRKIISRHLRGLLKALFLPARSMH